MIYILLAGKRLASIPAFKAALDRSDTKTQFLESGFEVLATVAKQGFDLLVTDEFLEDMTGLELIKSVIPLQPQLNCAAVSSRLPGDFHEASEGLGLLMQLSREPGQKEADRLLEQFRKIKSL